VLRGFDCQGGKDGKRESGALFERSTGPQKHRDPRAMRTSIHAMLEPREREAEP
jgi:hypothetical protein